MPVVRCPECSSNKLWKDGIRKTNYGGIQRWLCRDCGYRFSESNSNHSDKPEHVPKVQSSFLNSPADTISNCQICVTEPKGAKNLVAVKPLKAGLAGATKPTNADTKGKIVEYSFWLLKQGYAKSTIKGRTKLIKRLRKLGANLYDPESIKEIIAKQEWSIGRKANAVDAYTSFLQNQKTSVHSDRD